MILQPIIDIAEICAQLGVKEVVVSPGSRSALLTLAFVRHPAFRPKVISDERAAAFMALGMAQVHKVPTVLICTSGTAVYNFAPAVAEAYYQQVPLLVLTADRPPEWIGQWDGQTIQQQQIFGQHVKSSMQLPASYQHPDEVWHVQRIVSDSFHQAISYPQGPVHINVPIREPFYPQAGEVFAYSKNLRVRKEIGGQKQLNEAQWAELTHVMQDSPRKMLLIGQQDEWELDSYINELSQKGWLVVSDVIGNCTNKEAILHSDSFLPHTTNTENLRPDLLITMGKSIISKNLKLFLRKHKPTHHWHVAAEGAIADPFQTLTQVLRTDERLFLPELVAKSSQGDAAFAQQWKKLEKMAINQNAAFFEKQSSGEWAAIYTAMQTFESGNLHLANSMAVRYANFVGNRKKSVRVFANRGTSGIDGSNSTALGSVWASKVPTLLITGDMAFFYDRNAFWHNCPMDKLCVLVLNNHAGGIFGLIDGPSQQPELEEFFETNQALNAESLAQEFKLGYVRCQQMTEVQEAIVSFMQSGKGQIIEVVTDKKQNKAIFQEFKKQMQQALAEINR
ncbi:2-succinyl-5-enolpyruvyl-6-hydroxy-3-cyclohexene-1-carboxylic-acid synthase [Cytophagales bacterium LB-30]|uniref:2-succinyl-5-enolpyruvyl-6-hydroxy-3-cyclohexene-1-carboxylate synthase n=1 Tax=Shiella aurantiaca TaxID=3058365 RepID=A0ABT8F1L1_9BACT|nr:2-succinyl-5-enolpyruvyl-6-hydroxy-3-cyclohexene-1-carboxylic-acid synthase [Shiella aurantiaca]MDN4164126.1 2-succinyl-5-enolpyruvyl-6-hydroxy-3-cyclohexene-1-carboxylic-acid synthase [Shiella aurantiaca]